MSTTIETKSTNELFDGAVPNTPIQRYYIGWTAEMKFASAPYTISKEEEQRLRHRIESLKATLSPKQSIHLTMITTYGVAYGKHSGIVQKEVKMEDLFK